MASKRLLKKDINYLTFELLTECLTFHIFHPEVKPEVIDEISVKIIDNRNELISRINHVNGKENPKLVKAHFNKIIKDFEKSVELLDNLSVK